MKKKLRRFAEDAEISAVRSLLKWKYKKDGKSVPSDAQIEQQSREAASLANDVIAKTGKTVWHDLKKVYREHRAENDSVKSESGKKGGTEKGREEA